MGIVHKFRDYILESELKITILENRVDIVNYTEIGHFDSNKIIVRHDKGNIVINGNNLVVSKLLMDEVLISGTIKNIELR
jgi:sporulation protein YqfC